ncbi:hypothetical protein QVD17_34909 [Tagetes erecta]|uniref:Uncharacterized protein n=1 Tax=Tagetes erecta TaxID=13708 RepID=A0AAD8K2M8_TARER|nr:hypothetical protein QVD17_34909 [Tagetes erecta]
MSSPHSFSTISRIIGLTRYRLSRIFNNPFFHLKRFTFHHPNPRLIQSLCLLPPLSKFLPSLYLIINHHLQV